jgi:hypothetical protein
MASASLYAVQHVRRMRGGSQAHLLRASDNHYYVTKFQNNPQHIRILFNEYFATKLGIRLGLPMPDVQIIDVSEWLIDNTPELKIDAAGLSVPCAAGLQCGSEYAADPEQSHIFDYLPEAMFKRISNLNAFAQVLVFDKWTGNSDGRQAIFVKARHARSYQAMFIDQGYSFNAGEWDFSDRDLRGVYAHNSVYETVTGWNSFEPVLSRLEHIEFSELWRFASDIPKQWYENDSEGLSELISTLIKRRTLVRNLINQFRLSSRNPFANWTTV